MKYAYDGCKGIEDNYVSLSEDRDTIYVYLEQQRNKLRLGWFSNRE
ncbi:MAG: hypothetical protein QN229_04215 [Desulfurococcaceae archaeon TW002]